MSFYEPDEMLAHARNAGFRSIEQMNDHSTHAEVLAAFDMAIVAVDRRAA